jgi:hypothetical protein
MSNTRPVFALAVASLLLPAHSKPQSLPLAEQTAPPTLQSNASLVLVDVVVTNKGKPVQGLKENSI